MMSSKNVLLKVVILGDGNVGKTCLMQRYVNNKFNESSCHTIGVEFLNKEIQVDDKLFILQIWDTAGQERFKSLRTPFYRGSDVCLLVYSVEDRDSFTNLAKWKDEFVYYADIRNPSNFPFVILGNKVDVGDEKRKVQTEECLEWCKDNGDLPYFEISAKESTNVEEAFQTAVRIWVNMSDKEEKVYDRDVINVIKYIEEPARKLNYCCYKT